MKPIVSWLVLTTQLLLSNIDSMKNIPSDILINVLPWQTRIALVADGKLREISLETETKHSALGSVYLGKVTKILKSANAAFVDCGLERATFLSGNDARSLISEDRKQLNISELVHEGEKIIVQLIKEPIGHKGAQVRTGILLPGRFLVFRPSGVGVNVSRKLENGDERKRLSNIVASELRPDEGVIIRTGAEGEAPESIIAELASLKERWSQIVSQSKKTKKPGCINEELPPVLRYLRDRLVRSINSIVVDDRAMFFKVQEFCTQYFPEVMDKLELRLFPMNSFDDFEIEEQLENLVSAEVSLPSGGTIVLEETQAVTVVDVNTAKYRNTSSRDKAVIETNTEAAKEIPVQLQLRNIGGIVVIDFINMKDDNDRSKVMTKLKKATQADPAPIHVSNFSEFGTVELTRRRVGNSHLHSLYEQCEECQGLGRIKTVNTVALEILRTLWARAQLEPGQEFSVLAAPEVIETLNVSQRNAINKIELKSAASFNLIVNDTFARETFELLSL